MRTLEFKAHLQALVKDRLGIKVSKETAWALFKDVIFGTVQFTVNTSDKFLSLSGDSEELKLVSR